MSCDDVSDREYVVSSIMVSRTPVLTSLTGLFFFFPDGETYPKATASHPVAELNVQKFFPLSGFV